VGRRIQWTDIAIDDLKEVRDYIARDSKHYASAFVRKARDAARSLNQFAERGRHVPEFDRPDIRELIIGSYRLIYLLTSDRAQILAFIHGARDLQSLWQREGRNLPPKE
jgi:toxin ParE1/3/4